MNGLTKSGRDLHVSPDAPIIDRLAALDGLRGIAILLVLMHNMDILDEATSHASKIVDSAMDHGWIGVQLFFVLSGYLITAILINTKTAPNYYSAFYARRMLRIFPLYYATLFVAFVLIPAFFQLSPDTLANQQNQLWLWFFVSNWGDPYGHGVTTFPHFWSLAVEEQFYLLWPFIVRQLSSRALFKLCIAIVIAAFAIRVGLLAAGQPPDAVYMLTPCRMDALAVGAFIAALLSAHKNGISSAKAKLGGICVAFLFVAGALVTGQYSRLSPLGQTVGYLILSLVCGAAVFYAIRISGSNSWFERILSGRVIRNIGKYSFAIYVLHVPIHHYIGMPLRNRFIPTPNLSVGISAAYVLAVFAVTYIAAVISYNALEKPFLSLKRHFVPKVPSAALAPMGRISSTD